MNCHECGEQVQQILDGEPPGNALEAHLSSCRHCRELHAAACELLHGLALIDRPVAPAGLADTIVRAALRDRALRRRRRWLVTAAAAAAAILIVVTLWRPGNDRPRINQEQVVADAEPVPASLEENVQQAGQALADLTRRTAADTLGTGRTFLPSVEIAGGTEKQLALPDVPAEPRRAWSDAVGGVSVGLEPLAASARQAASFFRREVPLLNQESGPGM
jgi:hypothetical protein